jgi:hypothetical protein
MNFLFPEHLLRYHQIPQHHHHLPHYHLQKK